MSSATICPVPNHAYTICPSVTGLGLARLCLSCTPASGPTASTLYSHNRLPSARANASTTKTVLSPSAAGAGPSARSPEPLAAAPCARRGWFPGFRTPDPICDVTNTRSPATIGLDTPWPASGAFHATFSVGDQRSGRFFSVAIPLPAGPRQFGQSDAVPVQTYVAAMMTPIRKDFIAESLREKTTEGALVKLERARRVERPRVERAGPLLRRIRRERRKIGALHAQLFQARVQAAGACEPLEPCGELVAATGQRRVPFLDILRVPAHDVRQHGGNRRAVRRAVARRQRIRARVRGAEHRQLDRDAGHVRAEQHRASRLQIV